MTGVCAGESSGFESPVKNPKQMATHQQMALGKLWEVTTTCRVLTECFLFAQLLSACIATGTSVVLHNQCVQGAVEGLIVVLQGAIQ